MGIALVVRHDTHLCRVHTHPCTTSNKQKEKHVKPNLFHSFHNQLSPNERVVRGESYNHKKKSIDC